MGGNPAMMMAPQGQAGALPTIINSGYNTMGLGQHPLGQQAQPPLQQHPGETGAMMRNNARLQAQYDYSADFGGGGGGQGLAQLNPNSGYSGMQQQLGLGGGNANTVNQARRQVSRENANTNAVLAAGVVGPGLLQGGFPTAMAPNGAGGGGYGHHGGGGQPMVAPLTQQQPAHAHNAGTGHRNVNAQHRTNTQVSHSKPALSS
jgi:hypothetical protein